MNYFELKINTADQAQAEIYMAYLADFPFESFETEGNTLKAYIREDQLESSRKDIDYCLGEMGVEYDLTEIETVNWNEVWESNFQPVSVEGKCTIRAPFHEVPQSGYDIVIMPKMSFGTGHHATTWAMVALMLDFDFRDKNVLDMGSGTGVLAILAAKMRCRRADAVDIDQWAFENCAENIEANDVAAVIYPILGTIESVLNNRYDVILANINRNILLEDMDKYYSCLNAGGALLMSGILEEDMPVIQASAVRLGLEVAKASVKDGWAAVMVRK